MELPVWAVWLGSVLAATVTAFAVGRRIGLRQGRQAERQTLPISLRAEALAEGFCPICGGQPRHDTIQGGQRWEGAWHGILYDEPHGNGTRESG